MKLVSLAFFKFSTRRNCFNQCFSFRDVRTSEIKLQFNNAAGGRLYFTRPHIPETETKRLTTWNSFSVCTSWNWNKNKTVHGRLKRSPVRRPSSVLFYFSFISPCATGFMFYLRRFNLTRFHERGAKRLTWASYSMRFFADRLRLANENYSCR